MGSDNVQYSRISLQEERSLVDEGETNDEDEHHIGVLPDILLSEESEPDTQMNAVSPTLARPQSQITGNDTPNPFSRRPSKARDFSYAAVFISHLILVSVLSGTEDLELHRSINLWSGLMICTIILGSCLGITAVYLLSRESCRENILYLGVPITIALELVLANIISLSMTKYSFLGLLILAMAIVDSFSLKLARDNLGFTSTLLEMASNICRPYGLSMTIICGIILVAQTALLIWWEILFVGLVSRRPSGISFALVVAMLMSLYWTMQFFQALISYIIGGCVLWHFLKDSSNGSSSVSGSGMSVHSPSRRVLFHLHCGLTSSLGSLCKGALFCSASEMLFRIRHWADNRGVYVTPYSVKGCVGSLTERLTPFATRNHRLAYCLTATYGRTFSTAADGFIKAHPEVLEILSSDTTNFSLACTAKETAGLLVLCVGFLFDRSTDSYVLYLLLYFITALSGVSLALNVYRAAVDAIIVAFFILPDKLQQENQIVFLRFLRIAEAALR